MSNLCTNIKKAFEKSDYINTLLAKIVTSFILSVETVTSYLFTMPRKVILPPILDSKKKNQQKDSAAALIDSEARELEEEEEQDDDDGDSADEDYVDEMLSQSVSPSTTRRRRIVTPPNSDEEDEDSQIKKRKKPSSLPIKKRNLNDDELSMEELVYMQDLISAYESFGKRVIGTGFKPQVIEMKEQMANKPKATTAKAYLSVLGKNQVIKNRSYNNGRLKNSDIENQNNNYNNEEEREEETSCEAKTVWAVKEIPYSVRNKEKKKYSQADLIKEQCSPSYNLSTEGQCYIYKGSWGNPKMKKFIRLNFIRGYVGDDGIVLPGKKKFEFLITPIEVEALAVNLEEILMYLRKAEKEEDKKAERLK